MRGMPIIIWLLLILSWAAMRFGISWSPSHIAEPRAAGPAAMAGRIPQPVQNKGGMKRQIGPKFAVNLRQDDRRGLGSNMTSLQTKKPVRGWMRGAEDRAPENFGTSNNNIYSAEYRRKPSQLRPVASPFGPEKVRAKGRASDNGPIIGPEIGRAVEKRPSLQKDERLSWYGYSFWRKGKSGNGGSLATAAQYGGSQSGLIGTYRLTGSEASGLFAMMRTAITPGKFSEQEVAAGLRWRPSSSLPITLTAERRVRFNGKDQFALYAAGGGDNVPLDFGVNVSGFGQAGIVPGKKTDIFFDAGLRADRHVIAIAGVDLAAGIGAWAGGQRGAARLDTGPAISGKFHVAGARVQVNADWRIKVTGNAEPGSGPALTISTGF